jgi:hypothetical protein
MEKNAKPEIAYFHHQKSGCFWYRIKNPMEALKRAGVNTQMINLGEDLTTDNLKSLQVYGIYPFSFDKALESFKKEGKKVIYDIDDALDLIDETNPFYYNVKKDTNSEKEMLKHADHITVATKGLETYMKGKTNTPITIVPNCYNPDEWTYQRPEREGIRIGFAGSTTHVDDLIMVLPAIAKLQQIYDVKFLIMGFSPNSYETWLREFRFAATTEKAKQALDKLIPLMENIKFEWIPYIDFDLYPSTLINMALDIGICPLKDTPFNNCRSASKAMEYTLAGALALASDTEAYRNDPTSILVKGNEWEEQLEFYVKNKDIRQKLQVEHLRWIQENRNVNNQVDLLKSIYL